MLFHIRKAGPEDLPGIRTAHREAVLGLAREAYSQEQLAAWAAAMIRVSKFHDKKPIIKDISLSYFYGAKIGVLGLNGAGKSTLLKILAGVDKDFQGETVLTPGHTIGYLEQDPLVDVQKTVREVVEEAVADTVALLAEFEEINAAFAEPMRIWSKVLSRKGQGVCSRSKTISGAHLAKTSALMASARLSNPQPRLSFRTPSLQVWRIARL